MANSSMGWLWHRQLAHVGMRNLAKLQKGEHILGLTNVVFEKDKVCGACQAGKQHGVPHPSKNIVFTTRPLELLHMDLFGPVAYISIGGNKYGFVIVNDYSRFSWVFFLQDKSEVQETFKKFARRAQNEFEVKIKRIRSDNGIEFKNTTIEEFLDEEGIKHDFSTPYTPQQNGVVERKNRTLIEAARTMLDEYKTSDQFWAEAINTACHAINRLYLHKILKSSKFAPKVDEGFILGYGSNAHAYHVFNKTSGCVEIVKDVTFDESNGSQEQIDPSFAEKEESPYEAIKKLAIGEVKPQERKEQEEEDGTKWPSAIPTHSPEVPEKWPEVQDMSESSRHSRKSRKEQAQDQVLRDAGSIPFQGINDD